MLDGDALFWASGQASYALRVLYDEDAPDPVKENMVPPVKLACWHKLYGFGTPSLTDGMSKDGFWRDLVFDSMDGDRILKLHEDGKLPSIEIKKNPASGFDVYTRDGDELVRKYAGIYKTSLTSHVASMLSLQECQDVLRDEVAFMPLWLHEGSFVSISCGDENARSQPGCRTSHLGWILCTKRDMLDDFEYPDSECLDESAWREEAEKLMCRAMELYGKYLNGETFRYELYATRMPLEDAIGSVLEDGGTWSKRKKDSGFFGSDIVASGMAESVGHGIERAIETGSFKTGRAAVKYVTQTRFILDEKGK